MHRATPAPQPTSMSVADTLSLGQQAQHQQAAPTNVIDQTRSSDVVPPVAVVLQTIPSVRSSGNKRNKKKVVIVIDDTESSDDSRSPNVASTSGENVASGGVKDTSTSGLETEIDDSAAATTITPIPEDFEYATQSSQRQNVDDSSQIVKISTTPIVILPLDEQEKIQPDDEDRDPSHDVNIAGTSTDSPKDVPTAKTSEGAEAVVPKTATISTDETSNTELSSQKTGKSKQTRRKTVARSHGAIPKQPQAEGELEFCD